MHMTKMHIMHWPTVTTFFGLHLVSSCLSLLQGHAKKCDRGMTSQRKHAGVLRIVVALSCCAFWCTCCTIAQISRHTADYEHYPAFCCTESGLAENAPAIEYAARGNTSETLLSPDEIV